jgi:diaminohydroxyphosphoribosylaminopyrimidine deaminase/5-amino-6-(5-phosphoribosylamino)uracil reductase
VIALDEAGSGQGCTVFVSLEPCTHHGRTPPCVDRLIAEGVANVVIGALDPDERVSGSGVRALRDAGVEVIVLDDPEARSVDPAYFRHRETGLPRVTLKYAMTLDGSVAAADRTSQWITSEEARRDAHLLRGEMDGVVVGAGTLRTDSPRLDVRAPGYSGPQPRPVVVAGATDLPTDGGIWALNPLVVTTRDRHIPGGELLKVNGEGDRPDPVAACRALAGVGLLDLLVEGGPTLAGEWLRGGVVTDGIVYLGARLGMGGGIPAIGGVFDTIARARVVRVTGVRTLGSDVAVTFEL